jgi:hypothetical protein
MSEYSGGFVAGFVFLLGVEGFLGLVLAWTMGGGRSEDPDEAGQDTRCP